MLLIFLKIKSTRVCFNIQFRCSCALRKDKILLTLPIVSINFLRHAGIFTAEEVVYIAREKLIRLQSLYIDQFRRLQYILKEKRRKYLLALKKEKETFCKQTLNDIKISLYFSISEKIKFKKYTGSIHDQTKETAKEKKLYEKLKALNRYHRRSGAEAILYRKSLERRAQVIHRAMNISLYLNQLHNKK